MENIDELSSRMLPDPTTSWRGVDLPALFYLITMLACYPLTYISRTYLHGQPPVVKHIYFTLCGLALMFANFGYDVAHSAVTVLVNYVLLALLGGTPLSVFLSFTFNMIYLLIGYVYFATDGYDLIWTTPHCILTVKLIGTAFDLYDGCQKEEMLSREQKQLNIKRAPSLLEFTGYAYFVGGCFAAPIFPIRQYLDFTAEKLLDNDQGRRPNCVIPALNRLGVGCVYLVLYTSLVPMFPYEYLMSAEFADSSFPYQAFVLICWGKIVLFKYCVIFLFTEGVCIMSGMAYNGKDEHGNALWDACTSFRPMLFERATVCNEVVRSFNVSTNLWVSRYIYKRLKFFNSRHISQLATLIFLAVWHGFYVGYFVGFAQEFLVFLIEAQVVDAVRRMPTLARVTSHPLVKILLLVLFRAWMMFVISLALVPFVLLRWRRINVVYSAMHYIPLCFYGAFVLVYQFAILPQLKKMSRKTVDLSAVSRGEDGETVKTK